MKNIINALALLVLCTLTLTGCGCLTIEWDNYFESGTYPETLDVASAVPEDWRDAPRYGDYFTEAILIDARTGRVVERTRKLKPVVGNGYRIIGYKAAFKHEGATDNYWYRIELETIDGQRIPLESD